MSTAREGLGTAGSEGPRAGEGEDPHAPYEEGSRAADGEGPHDQRPHWLTPLVHGWVVMVAIVVVVGRQLLENAGQAGLPSGRAVLVIAGLVLAVILVEMILGYFQWRFTRFRIGDEELTITRNFIWRTSERIAFSKIQSVDLVQPFAARLLGLARLRIDVGSDASKTIEYLSRADAVRFRDYLLRRAHGQQITRATSDATAGADIIRDRNPQDVLITSSSPAQIIGGTVLSFSFLFWTAFALAGVIMPAVYRFGAALGVGTLFAALVALATTIESHLIREWNFSLVRSGEGLKVTHGLTSLTTRSIPRHRVQGVVIRQPALWRLAGLHRIELSVLGSGVRQEEARVLLAVGTQHQVRQALAALWPQLRLNSVPLRPIPRRARWLRWVDQQTFRWGIDDQVIVSRHGLFVRTTAVVPHARAQSVGLTQGPVQRLLHLANVRVHISGSIVDLTCRNLDAQDARTLALTELDRARRARADEMQAVKMQAVEDRTANRWDARTPRPTTGDPEATDARRAGGLTGNVRPPGAPATGISPA